MEQDYRPRPMNARSKGLLSTTQPARARSIAVLIAALACAALMAWLGFWQLDRAAQKRALQQELENRSALPALPQSELASTPQEAANQYQRQIRLRGVWLTSATVFLENRQMNGRPGFFVLTPLRLDPEPAGAAAASGSSTPVVWVQRGWLVRDNDARTRLPEVPTPSGPTNIVGRVAPPPARLFELGAEASGPIRQNLDLDTSAYELGLTVLPLTVLQTEAPSSGPDGLLRQWGAPAAGIQKHYGYAFQWFALCSVVVGMYAWFQIIRPRRLAHRETV